MIDTDKYEGHDLSTDEKMNDAIEYIQGSIFDDEDEGRIAEANAQLMADAPLLLEEVKRLREGLYKLYADINSILLTKDALMRVKNVFDTSIPTTLINIKDLYEGKEMIE